MWLSLATLAVFITVACAGNLETTAGSTATPPLTLGPTYTLASSSALAPTATLVPTLTPTPMPTSTAMPTTTLTPPPTRAHTLTPMPDVPPKELALRLINLARKDAGVPGVELGINRAAQIHADSMSEHCFGGHWGLDGTTSEMRYTLAGGQQKSGENVSAPSFCDLNPFSTAGIALEKANEGLLNSPGHRKTLLDPNYRFVNIGIAWGGAGLLYLVQQFEGDYVRYTKVPVVEDGVLRLAGKTINGAVLEEPSDLGIQLVYSPPLQQLSKGQLASGYCLDAGLLVAEIRFPPEPGYRYTDSWFSSTYKRCPNPYDIPADSPAPESREEAIAMHEESRRRSQQADMSSFSTKARFVTASEWQAQSDKFTVNVDVGQLLEENGPGVYNIRVGAMMNGEKETVSFYSIFHEVEVPEGYGNR